MSETLMFAAAVIAALLSLLAALWLYGCVSFDDGIGEPVLTAKPEPRRVRAGPPAVDLKSIASAARLAAIHDFDHGGRTPNPEQTLTPAAGAWAVEYEATAQELRAALAASMLPTP